MKLAGNGTFVEQKRLEYELLVESPRINGRIIIEWTFKK
jgi:hypothetical protein